MTDRSMSKVVGWLAMVFPLVAAIRDSAAQAFVHPSFTTTLQAHLSTLSHPLLARWSSPSTSQSSTPPASSPTGRVAPAVWERAVKQTVTDCYEWLLGRDGSVVAVRGLAARGKDKLEQLPIDETLGSSSVSANTVEPNSQAQTPMDQWLDASGQSVPFAGSGVWSHQSLLFANVGGVGSGGPDVLGGGAEQEDFLDMIDPTHGAWRKPSSSRGTLLID